MRQAVAAVVGAGVAAVAALILGEYELDVLGAVVAGAILGLAVVEAANAVARPRARVSAVVFAALAAGSMLWAGWINVRHRDEPIPASMWIGAAVAAGVAAVRTSVGTGRSERSGSRPPGR